MSISKEQRSLLTVGLPSHGKTTYLAALWYRLTRNRIPSSLRLTRLPDEADYLNGISETWLDREPLLHTPSGTLFEVTLSLETSEGHPVEMVIPDYSGESIANAWNLRRWPGEFDDMVKRASAMALLVNPDYVYPAATIEALQLPGGVEATPPDPTIPPLVYDASTAPTQVQLVDFLQMALARRGKSPRPPVAVLVTAWDLVRDEGRTPEAWVRTRLPLLHQYLSSYESECRFAVFGISAQGGRLPDSREEGVLTDPIAKTESVRASGASSHDITEPISWLIEACR